LRNSAVLWFTEDGQNHRGEFWPPSYKSRRIRKRNTMENNPSASTLKLRNLSNLLPSR
jgi:hypothetical protein